MTLYILLAVLAFLAGCVLGYAVGIRTARAEIQRLKKRLERRDARVRGDSRSQPMGGALPEESPSGSQTASSEQSDRMRARGTERNVPETSQARIPVGTTDVSREAAPIARDQWYQKFGRVGTLAVQFNYSFPEKMYFQPGAGYIRNARNQVIPDKDVFSKVNTATGYAMEGLFWVFNVVYQGREYTFQQIMEGQMTSGYVRVEGIPALAVAEPTGVDGCYRLVQKGKLKIVDV